mgnify:CR=1 FL=1
MIVYKRLLKSFWIVEIYIYVFRPESVEGLHIHGMKLLNALLASIVSQLVTVVLLKIVLSKGAKWLTKREHRRTQEEFDKSYSLKIFFAYFINQYFILFYIAFVNTVAKGYPEKNGITQNERSRYELVTGNCNYELVMQLITIMVLKQFVLNNVKECFESKKKKYCEVIYITSIAGKNLDHFRHSEGGFVNRAVKGVLGRNLNTKQIRYSTSYTSMKV